MQPAAIAYCTSGSSSLLTLATGLFAHSVLPILSVLRRPISPLVRARSWLVGEAIPTRCSAKQFDHIGEDRSWVIVHDHPRGVRRATRRGEGSGTLPSGSNGLGVTVGLTEQERDPGVDARVTGGMAGLGVPGDEGVTGWGRGASEQDRVELDRASGEERALHLQSPPLALPPVSVPRWPR